MRNPIAVFKSKDGTTQAIIVIAVVIMVGLLLARFA